MDFLEPKFIHKFLATIVPSLYVIVSADVEVKALRTEYIRYLRLIMFTRTLELGTTRITKAREIKSKMENYGSSSF